MTLTNLGFQHSRYRISCPFSITHVGDVQRVVRKTSVHGLLKTNEGSEISGFHRDVDENWPLLSFYAASIGNSLETFQDKLSVPSSGVKNLVHLSFPQGCSLEDGTGMLPRNVCKKFPLLAKQ